MQPSQNKPVYFFGNGKAEGTKEMKALLGGKGANLAEMTNLGLPVPPGFTISTEVCNYFYQNKNQLPEGTEQAILRALSQLEEVMGARLGDKENPLLLSIRSGARMSMPGMMDTVLNLGLNDETVLGLKKKADARFAYDSYRRFIQMYSDVVLEVPSHHFENLLEKSRRESGVESDSELSEEVLKNLVSEFKKVVLMETGKTFPLDPKDQLWGAISAVFSSWNSARAISYRRIHKISENWGTAVNIQAMVFGNMGEDCATGVAFTRDPSTGDKRFFGEYLTNAQGEDVVAGIRTPCPINKESGNGSALPTLESIMPEAYRELVQTYQTLEKHYRDMQDIEFTIQKGKLYMLQTRTGKRTANSAVRIAVDMVEEGLISSKEAILRVSPSQIEQLLHPRLDPRHEREVVAKGLPASPGAASGEIVFSSEEAEEAKKKNKKVVLVRHETSPEDIGGMDAAEGILTALGGMTSHAAVVARGMGKPCVAGCGAISIDYKNQLFRVGKYTLRKGEVVTIDGATGEVILGYVPTINSQLDEYFKKFMSWVDQYRTLQVRANAETPHDVKVARGFGAEGVGLCRTEHMFFEESRIMAVREMILAESKEQREKALNKIFPIQKEDFKAIFQEMKGYPVTIRLLDPPLHEFLPKTDAETVSISRALGTSKETLQAKVRSLHEFNPMLGHRGCRLGVSFPEIYSMQVRAILEAACDLAKEGEITVEPEIMIPFIGSLEEYRLLKNQVASDCEAVLKEKKVSLSFSIGTMIEIPRAALIAGKLAEEADFFSFGTNDLTQMTLGLSRDDSGTFLPLYLEKGLYPYDPFVSLDEEGVGELVSLACDRARKTKSSIKIGICGEQGGDTSTIEFCHRLGFNYVSCSPFRVPVARLAAAQAKLKN